MNQKVNEIQITPVKPKNGLVAFASFVLNGDIYCSSVAIFTRPNGTHRLVYPTKKLGNKEINIFYPINKKIGNEIQEEVIKKFEDVMKNDRHSSLKYSKE